MKIVEYILLDNIFPTGLSAEINSLLEQEWELFGNGFCDNEGFIFQAMVKYKEQTPT
jgi:hypothetical protein